MSTVSSDDVTSDGRLFQVFAAATQNARSTHNCGWVVTVHLATLLLARMFESSCMIAQQQQPTIVASR